MKKLLCIFLLLVLLPFTHYAQSTLEGEVITKQFLAPSIQNNKGGEDPMRQISVYLPPGYQTSKDSYPTIYFLHGFGVDDSQIVQWLGFKQLLDKAIETNQIRPVIMVIPNSKTKFGGSFYTNSALTGNWADYIAKDVIEYIDKNYRTLANRENRALTGHSMGGNGALKIAMMYPDVFSTVYALSPGALGWAEDFSIESEGFKRIFSPKMESDMQDILNNFEGDGDFDAFYATIFINMGRAYTPSDKISGFGANYPIAYADNKPIINDEIKKIWETNFPLNMIDTHLDALRSLKAIKIDWGRNEDFPHIPESALQFSKKMESYGIEHFAEEYMGDHVNKLGGFDGRIYMDMLPFIEMNLEPLAIEIISKN